MCSSTSKAPKVRNPASGEVPIVCRKKIDEPHSAGVHSSDWRMSQVQFGVSIEKGPDYQAFFFPL